MIPSLQCLHSLLPRRESSREETSLLCQLLITKSWIVHHTNICKERERELLLMSSFAETSNHPIKPSSLQNWSRASLSHKRVREEKEKMTKEKRRREKRMRPIYLKVWNVALVGKKKDGNLLIILMLEVKKREISIMNCVFHSMILFCLFLFTCQYYWRERKEYE